jgi:small subunit ribosomal protein S16
MSLKIRLSRGGAKKAPFYRLVVADSRSPRDGRFIERVGTHDPRLPHDHKDRLIIKEDRIKHWMSVGAKPTDRVQRLLSKIGLAEAPAIPNQTKKDKPRAKTLERMKEAEEAAKAAAEAAASAEAEAAEAPAEEAPAEEAPAEEKAEG